MKKRYIIFHIEGGMGKNIAATAVVEAIKKQYPDYDIIVVTAWEDVWYHNPHIHRVYRFGHINYFYDDYINNKEIEDLKIFRQEVYHYQNQILEKNHLIVNWCNMYNIKYNNEVPRVYLTPREIENGANIIKKQNDLRPIFLIQTNGGMPQGNHNVSWMRDMPLSIAQQVVNHYNKIGYRTIHVRLEKQPQLQNVEVATLGLRDLYSVILHSNKRLLIDSFVQHLCAAFELPSVVLWVGNKPTVFGYSIHKNIVSNKKHDSEFLKYSYLSRYDIGGVDNQCPYSNLNNIFNFEEIIDSLEKQ